MLRVGRHATSRSRTSGTGARCRSCRPDAVSDSLPYSGTTRRTSICARSPTSMRSSSRAVRDRGPVVPRTAAGSASLRTCWASWRSTASSAGSRAPSAPDAARRKGYEGEKGGLAFSGGVCV